MYEMSNSYYDRCIGWCLYEMCTFEDPNELLNACGPTWPQLKLPNNISNRLNVLFMQMTRLKASSRPSISEILSDSSVFIDNISVGDCLHRRFKIDQEIEPNFAWNITDLKESKKKTMNLCVDNQEYKKAFVGMTLVNSNLANVLFTQFNDDIYFIGPIKQVRKTFFLYNLLIIN